MRWRWLCRDQEAELLAFDVFEKVIVARFADLMVKRQEEGHMTVPVDQVAAWQDAGLAGLKLSQHIGRIPEGGREYQYSDEAIELLPLEMRVELRARNKAIKEREKAKG